MSCEPLPHSGAPVTVLLLFATALLAAGALLVVAARARTRRAVVLATALLIGVSCVTGSAGPSEAHAAEPCGAAGAPHRGRIEVAPPATGPHPDDEPQSPFEINQVSVHVGIAPGTGGTPITGRVVNRGPAAIHVEAITVDIDQVIKAPAAVAGPCDKTDYDLRDHVMNLGATLAPGEGATFSGAAIGFHNKPINQDACQAATVTLLFRTS